MHGLGDSKWIALVLGLCSPVVALAASKTATLGVTAEVLPACTAGSSVPATLGQFGTLDFGSHFALAAAVTALAQGGNGGLRVNCIANTPYRVLISAGNSGDSTSRTLLGPAAASLSYNLYTAADYTTVWDDSTGVSGLGSGADQWLPVYGRVPAQAVPASGLYSDTVTVTVSW